MAIDKSWTNPEVDRNSTQFRQGLEAFIEMSKPHVDNTGKIRCACNHCHNTSFVTLVRMRNHINIKGFSRSYANNIWSNHGETLIPPVVNVVNVVPPSNEMLDLIDDVMEDLGDNDTDLGEGEVNLNTGGSGSGSGGGDEYEKLLEEAQSELYPGCSGFSSLNFLAKLMYIKVNNRWSDRSFDQLLQLLNLAFPKENKVPSSHYDAKKTLKKIGLGYESIHVCKNNCILYWREDKALQYCRVCNESRWVDKDTKGKKIPHKVLRHFPATHRLRRLYCSRHTAEYMTWHSTGRSEDGTLRHPVDGTSWKEFDLKYPDFAREPRNVRLGLAADGFNPYGTISNPHSTWPVILTAYNLPPWLCMKESTFMLTLLIPGPKSPGKDMDVFLRPLVEELKELWHTGVRIKDAATNTFFTMKAMLLWTINDFPARSSLSGWSGQGYKACPTCNKDTPSYRVRNKVVYVGHRRFLDPDDSLRRDLKFNGKEEIGAPPRQFSNEEIEAQLGVLLSRLPGNHPNFGGRKIRREDFELNWSKKSIFFELEYWSSLQLKHNLDVMHIEKNVCDSVLGTLLQNDKSKDTSTAREDLKDMGIRQRDWLKRRGDKYYKPRAKYSLEGPDRKFFCEFIKDVKLPDGFGSNISKRVSEKKDNITGLKSHDCHILMQRLIPIGVRGLLSKDTYTPIVDLCMFFKQICSRALSVDDMRQSKEDIIQILCKLELIYPPAFFDIMVHLVLHLPDEAICGGPVYFRWMYPFERYMKKLKNYVRNNARVEGSIAEGYVAEEALSFCSMYLQDIETRFNRPERNDDVEVEKTKLWIFECRWRPTSQAKIERLEAEVMLDIEWWVLNACLEVRRYITQFNSENPHSDDKAGFPTWFRRKVYDMKTNNSPEFHNELYALSVHALMNVHIYTSCIVNGARFMVFDRDTQRATQNSGVESVGEGGEKYYGQLEEIMELQYPLGYSTVIFRCKWFHSSTDKNITTIDKERELHQDDQLVFASQVKQVFYVRVPSRGNQSQKWVVENVNHRKIWDLPSVYPVENVNNDSVPNVDNASNEAENVDVVHSSSSSECRLVIDFSRYFQNIPVVEVAEDEREIEEVLPPKGRADYDSASESEYPEYDPEYENEGSDEIEEGSDGENV